MRDISVVRLAVSYAECRGFESHSRNWVLRYPYVCTETVIYCVDSQVATTRDCKSLLIRVRWFESISTHFYDGGYGEMVNALDCGSSYCEFDPH